MLVNRLRNLASSEFNIDFSLDKARFNVGRHTIRIENFKVMVPGNEPFLKAEKLNLYLASGTGLLDYYFARAVIERAEMVNATFDTRQRRPKPRNPLENPFNILPITQAEIKGFNLQTESSCLTFNDFHARLIKGYKNANLVASIGSGPFGGAADLRAMIDLVGSDSTVKFSWKHDNIALFTPLALVKHYYGFAISDGKIDIALEWSGDIGKRIDEPGQDLLKLLNQELVGNLSLKTGNFSWAGFAGALEVKGSRKPGEPWKISLKNQDKAGKLLVDAVWTGDEKSFSKFRAQFVGEKIQVSDQLIAKLPHAIPGLKPGGLEFQGTLDGKDGKFVGSGTFAAADWSIHGIDLNRGKLNWRIGDDSDLQLQTMIEASAGKIHASATIPLWSEENGQIEGSVLQVDLETLETLGRFVNFPVSGIGSGFFKVDLQTRNLASSSYEFDFDLQNTHIAAFQPEIIRGRILGSGNQWKVENPSAEFGDGGLIELKGVISPELLNADVLVENVDLKNFAVPQRIVSGSAFLKASISGSFADPQASGEVWGSGLQIFSRDISSVKAQIQLQNHLLDLSPMVIIPQQEGMIDGFYSFNLENGETRSFKLNFQKLGVDFIGGFFPGVSVRDGLAGKVSGSISFKKQQKDDHWDFLIDGGSLNLYDQFIDSLFLEGSIIGGQGEIRNLFVRSAGGTLNVIGQVLGPESFDGSIEVEDIRLEKVSYLSAILPGLRGQLDMQGNIEWKGAEKKGYFTLFGEKIMANQRELGNLGAEVEVDNAGMKIIKAEFDRLGVALEGKVQWQGKKDYEADLILKNVDLSFLTQAHGIKTFDYGGLVVDGQCSISGNLASLTPDVVEMQLDAIKIQKDQDVIVSNRPMQLKYQNNSLEVRSLELKYRQGILGIEGIFKPGFEMALMVNGSDFSIRALGSLLDLPDWNYDGSLSAQASVFGRMQDLKLRADTRIDNFIIADRKINGVSARLSGDTRQLNLEELKVKLPASSFEMKGQVSHNNFIDLTGINLDLSIPRSPISDLPTFLPGIFRQASGSIQADLHLNGDPRQPQIAGQLSLLADELGISGMRKPFKNLKFAASTQDSIINIDEMSASLGRGNINGNGSINFRDGPGSISARLSGEKLDFSFLNFELERASATFSIGGNLYNPQILGDVLVPRGKFHLSTDLLKDRPNLNLFLKSLNYRVNVEVPRNFWLKSSFLNAEMKGKFSVLGDLDKVNLEGGISSVQGWLFFQRRKFRIDTGEIRFGGVEDSFDPHIYVKSEGQVQNTQVYLTLKGRISSMTPKIYSSPPMSEGDLLSLLTLGRDISSAMQSDTRDLFESEILEGLKNTYISALIGNTISAALNLDELFLTSLYDKTEGRSRSFIRAGKYIGQNIFMAYEGTLDEREEETFIFEYRLPKGFVVNLEFEKPEKDKRVGVRYDWKFW